jgi:glycosyltransferase involved in cell wall biosynthesis
VGEYHGAGMRFINFARHLSKAGASVYFAVNVWSGDDQVALDRFLTKLELEGVIAGSVVIHYSYSRRQGRMGAMVLHPGLTNWILKDLRQKPVEAVLGFARDVQITAAIVSDRKLLFLADELQKELPTVFDWTDSMALYYWRALRTKFRTGNFEGLVGFLRDYQTNVIAEAYYGRRATLNTVVSPVDKLWLDRVTLQKSRNRVWMNGTKTDGISAVKKVPKRLIFSGTMDYRPNYEGALWFLDNVFPQVSATHPDTQIVIAGIHPEPRLLARATNLIHITGFVPDLGQEIARSSLYIAPLLSGGGFRNKVIEAIMNGTYLIGTAISVEFLPIEVRSLITVANSAQDMSAAIVNYLDDPEAYDDRLKSLREIVTTQFSWHDRSHDMVDLLIEAGKVHSKLRTGHVMPIRENAVGA